LLNQKYPELLKDGLGLLAINVGERAYKVDNFVKSYKLTYKILLDEDTTVADAYEVLGVPTYVLINKKGNISFVSHSFPEDKYKDLIQK
jgi:peroxiredoxin